MLGEGEFLNRRSSGGDNNGVSPAGAHPLGAIRLELCCSTGATWDVMEWLWALGKALDG